jgi:Integrase zinc binding domain
LRNLALRFSTSRDPIALLLKPSPLTFSTSQSTEELLTAVYYDPSDDFPGSFAIIAKYQLKDNELQSRLVKHPEKDESRVMNKSTVIFQANSERMVILKDQQQRIIKFCHRNIKHPGVIQNLKTIQQLMVLQKMQPSAEKYVNHCAICQTIYQKYYKLPTKIPVAVPWVEVNVDHFGPYSQSDHSSVTKYFALSIIDPATSLAQLSHLPYLTAATTCAAFDNQWFCRKPRPLSVFLIKAVPSLQVNSKSYSLLMVLFQAQLQFKPPRLTLFLNAFIKLFVQATSQIYSGLTSFLLWPLLFMVPSIPL